MLWLRERSSCTQNTRAAGDRCDNKQWLIDCGPPRAPKRGGEVNDIDAIYFTHVHPDHQKLSDGATEPLEKLFRQKPVIIYCQLAQQPVLMQLAALANWLQADLVSPSTGRNAAKLLDVV